MPKLPALAFIQHLADNGFEAELQMSPGAQTDDIMYVNVIRKMPPANQGNWVRAQPKVGGVRGYQPFRAPGMSYCKAFKDIRLIPEATQSIQNNSYEVKSIDAVTVCNQLGIVPPRRNLYN
ncbi:hypothetical protein OKW21_005539 [Catalinimonas alkaloidigena]|uniref:hypothetical protein n=1 Tax=Catalinimonas alkaloidigena TaxID=1075417 RepID=UPI0024056F0A|nr:hypothetical protein [Catalinimonas alkaloidigena]MDF9800276.1 hypothetical protein [Catalinimonas alkaloidigena]